MKSNLVVFLALFFLSVGTSGAYDMFEELKKSSKTAKKEIVDNNGRSKEEIMRVVDANMPELKGLYSKYLKQKPGFSGKIVLKFTIAASGEIVKINIVSSTTGYAKFDKAIKDKVAAWKWEEIKDGGDTTPTIPFNFTEDESWDI